MRRRGVPSPEAEKLRRLHRLTTLGSGASAGVASACSGLLAVNSEARCASHALDSAHGTSGVFVARSDAAMTAYGRRHGECRSRTIYREAQEAIRTDSASPKAVSPNTKDAGRAAEARRGGAASDRAGSTMRSDDPQLEGIDAEGAKDPLYQAAYRTCMRKSGF